jgi:hypothetical protein
VDDDPVRRDDPARRDGPARYDDPVPRDDPADRTEPADPPRRPDLRVGDADRQAALQALGAHLEAGRLDIDEYGDRSACAAVAVRRAELAALFDDLPAPHPALPERPVPGPPAAAPVPVERHGRDRAPAVHGLMIGLVLVMIIALPGLMIAAGAAGMGGGGLLFLPLMLLLAGGGRPGRRRFGPGGPGGPGRGPWHG